MGENPTPLLPAANICGNPDVFSVLWGCGKPGAPQPIAKNYRVNFVVFFAFGRSQTPLPSSKNCRNPHAFLHLWAWWKPDAPSVPLQNCGIPYVVFHFLGLGEPNTPTDVSWKRRLPQRIHQMARKLSHQKDCHAMLHRPVQCTYQSCCTLPPYTSTFPTRCIFAGLGMLKRIQCSRHLRIHQRTCQCALSKCIPFVLPVF